MWAGRAGFLQDSSSLCLDCHGREGFLGGPRSPFTPDGPWAQGRGLWFGGGHLPQSRNWRFYGARLPLTRRGHANREARRRVGAAQGGSRNPTHLSHSLPRRLQLFPTRRGGESCGQTHRGRLLLTGSANTSLGTSLKGGKKTLRAGRAGRARFGGGWTRAVGGGSGRRRLVSSSSPLAKPLPFPLLTGSLFPPIHSVLFCEVWTLQWGHTFLGWW